MKKIVFEYYRLCCVIGLLVVGLASCGGGENIVTTDDSADYQSARTLPPLKKTIGRTSQTDLTSQADITHQTGLTSQGAVVEQGVSTPEVKNVETTFNLDDVHAQVVSIKGNIARLEINSVFDGAWAYMSAGLKASNVTVYNRNKVAGRFAIGCNNIDGAPVMTKKSKWSILSKKPTELEYCAMQLTGAKKNTTVTVLNRSGLEVDADTATQLFKRIFNN